jgi:hypothetical protein
MTNHRQQNVRHGAWWLTPATLGTNPGFRGYPDHDSLRLGQCP